MRPVGTTQTVRKELATRRAARTVGDHALNTLRVDPVGLTSEALLDLKRVNAHLTAVAEASCCRTG
jgi:hypothetical protein